MASKQTHTPGPWEVRQGFRDDTFEVFPTRGGPPELGAWAELATVVGDYSDDEAEGRANARLIAAAPDLLDALEACAEQLAHCLGPDTEAGRKARAALSKAQAA